MEKISNIRFNLTPEMADKIVEINNLKMKLLELKKQGRSDNNINKELSDLEEEIYIQKTNFIKEFQANNKEQIDKYLELKNKEN